MFLPKYASSLFLLNTLYSFILILGLSGFRMLTSRAAIFNINIINKYWLILLVSFYIITIYCLKFSYLGFFNDGITGVVFYTVMCIASALLQLHAHCGSIRSVRDLGIYLDSDLAMRTHVRRTVSSCFAVLRQIVASVGRSVVLSCSQISCRWCCHVWITVVQH